MKRIVVVVLLLAASLGLPGRAPGAARADNSPFGDLLTTINTLGPEVTALQALAPTCHPTDPCLPAGSVTLINAGTLTGFNQRSFDNTVLHNAASILALRGALDGLNIALPFCGDLACSESLATYLASQEVDLTTVVAVAVPPNPIIPPNPIRLYFIPSDPCVPQLTVAACKG
jgi:hypothetical protein